MSCVLTGPSWSWKDNTWLSHHPLSVSPRLRNRYRSLAYFHDNRAILWAIVLRSPPITWCGIVLLCCRASSSTSEKLLTRPIIPVKTYCNVSHMHIYIYIYPVLSIILPPNERSNKVWVVTLLHAQYRPMYIAVFFFHLWIRRLHHHHHHHHLPYPWFSKFFTLTIPVVSMILMLQHSEVNVMLG